jgi:predicted PurR-regulated permease PerM
VLVLAIVLVIGVVALILVQAISGSVRGFSDDLPQIVDKARHSDLGGFINRGSDSLETLRKHASDIANGVGKASGGVAHVGASAFGAVALAFSVVFLTLFGLVDEPALAGPDREPAVSGQAEAVPASHGSNHPHDFALHARQLGHLCDLRDGLRRHRVGARPPVPARRGGHRGILDLIPSVGATIAGIIIGLVALSVSLQALVFFVIVMVVYQQIENYILQPTIIGKAAEALRLHRAYQRPRRSGRSSD